MPKASKRGPSPFNSPVETGLRMLALLEAASPDHCDLSRLVVHDYLLVHSGDVPNGPKSLHPNTPHRSGELLVRRRMILDGLILLITRELAGVKYSDRGITYFATRLTGPFLKHMDSIYAKDLQERATWVVSRFRGYSDHDLNAFAMAHLNDWGGELVNEALLRRVGDAS